MENADVIITDSINDIVNIKLAAHYTHALCTKGRLDFKYAGRDFTLKIGDCMIILYNELISDLAPSDDFETTVLYATHPFIMEYLPTNNYDIIGRMTMFHDPIIPLTDTECRIYLHDIDEIRARLEKPHRFKRDMMGYQMEIFVLDLFDFHARYYGDTVVSEQQANLLRRFVGLLQTGDFKSHREVTYYASRLCVTPKYLSEVCKKISGVSANFWIERFTIIEITQLLSRKDLSLQQIVEEMNFSSLSYFSRYVQRVLNVTPSEFRSRL